MPPGDAEELIKKLKAQNQRLREEHHEAEEARQRYLHLYEFAPVGYLILNQRGTILDLNLAGTKMLGLPKNQLVGMPFAFFLPDYSLHDFNQYLKKVFSTDENQTHEFCLKPKYQNSVAYVSLQSIALTTDKNVSCFSAVIDITERKSAEQEVTKAREELVERNAQLRHLSSRLLDIHEEDRIRIACDVHDSFASLLCVMKNQLQSFRGKGEDDRLNQVFSELDSAILDALRIQKMLRPPALDDLGLFPTLNMLCREFRDSHAHIRVEKKFLLDEGKVPGAIVVPIFRITEEALNNIAAHSMADSVTLSLGQKDSFIEFVVQDNGKGFNVEEILDRGMERGLSTMRERAVLSGGSFRIESEAGKGTTVRVFWPFG